MSSERRTRHRHGTLPFPVVRQEMVLSKNASGRSARPPCRGTASGRWKKSERISRSRNDLTAHNPSSKPGCEDGEMRSSPSTCPRRSGRASGEAGTGSTQPLAAVGIHAYPDSFLAADAETVRHEGRQPLVPHPVHECQVGQRTVEIEGEAQSSSHTSTRSFHLALAAYMALSAFLTRSALSVFPLTMVPTPMLTVTFAPTASP